MEMVVRTRTRNRIEVHLSSHATERQHRELGAFARYCIQRVERELGEREAWTVNVKPSLEGHTSHIAVHHRGGEVEAQASGHDGTLAIWEAMCLLEQRLREGGR
jgi:ribosome-associated translation inhibitor RaiA